MNETVVRSLSARRKAIILVSCCLSLLIVSMDATIVNVAIPTIRTDLHASPSQLQWVIDIYTLVLASLLMLSGATGDRFGRRRIFQIGLTVFALGSLLCSLAPNIEMLIGARFVQAVGGSMLNPVALSIISQVFTGRVERARAIGVWGGGGRHLDGARPDRRRLADRDDRLARRVLDQPADLRAGDPADRDLRARVQVGDDARHRPGRARAWLCSSCSAWSTPSSRVPVWAGPTPASSPSRVVALLAFVAFLRYESRRHDPFIDLRFFRSIPFASATMIAVCAFAAWGAFLFMMSLYLQDERGFSAMHTGLIYLPIADWRADVFAAVGSTGRPLRQPGRRCWSPAC